MFKEAWFSTIMFSLSEKRTLFPKSFTKYSSSTSLRLRFSKLNTFTSVTNLPPEYTSSYFIGMLMFMSKKGYSDSISRITGTFFDDFVEETISSPVKTSGPAFVASLKFISSSLELPDSKNISFSIGKTKSCSVVLILNTSSAPLFVSLTDFNSKPFSFIAVFSRIAPTSNSSVFSSGVR